MSNARKVLWQSYTTTVEIVLIYCVVYITDKGNAIDIQIDCYVQNHTQIVRGLVHPVASVMDSPFPHNLKIAGSNPLQRSLSV